MSCWSTPAPPSTAKPCKVRKEARAAAGLPGLRGPKAGARFPRGRAGAGKRAAVRTWHCVPALHGGGPDLWALRPRRKAGRARRRMDEWEVWEVLG